MGGQLSSVGSVYTRPDDSSLEDWMSALYPELWDLPLHHLSIPGSHDTMTYCLNRKSPVAPDQSWLLRLLTKLLPCVTRPVVLKWAITQDLDVTAQLSAGVRYLDLRVAHMRDGTDRNLHFLHVVYTTALVEEVPSLRQLWAWGQQVLLSYEDEETVSRHPELWPGIPYWWGDKVKPQDLVCYLERMKSCGRPGGLFVAGTNLTETLEYVLAHLGQSLRSVTLPGLPFLGAWVRAQCPGPASRCTNIIAGDFIGATSFVSDVVGLNRKLLQC